jgi:hypothetical protein
MVIPAIPLPLVFAVGLAIGVIGYLGRETIIRARARRRAADAAAAGWGPTRATAADAPVTAPVATSTVPPAVEPATKKGGRKPKYGATQAPPKAAPVAEPVATAAVGDGLAPVTRAALADRRQKAAALTQLHKRESYLDYALDAIVGFVDAEPRRARARICAKALSDLVPRARRSPQFNDFLRDAESGKAPLTLQDDAELVGVQLATELKQVKTELISLSG